MASIDGLPDRLKDARRAARMSQGQLAESLCKITGTGSVTRHEVSRWERGERTPTVWLPELARALNVTVPYLEARPDHPDRDTDGELELLRRFHAAQVVDPELIALLDRETDTIRAIDRRLGVVAAATKLAAHIEQIEQALRYNVRAHIRSSLAASLADTSALAGWQAIDAGRLSAAWDHFERAKLAAREADSPASLAHASGEQAYVLSDLRLSGDALDLITSVQDDAVPVRLRVWLAMAKAEIAACAGDEPICRDALATADALLPVPPEEPALPYLFIDGPHLLRWRGNCLARFGDPGTLDALQIALDTLEPGSFNRAEAALRCDLATAFIAHGEHNEAEQHAARAADLAALTGSVRQRRRVIAIHRRLGDGAR